MNRLIIALFMIICMTAPALPESSDKSSVLKTTHFLIRYDSNETAFAEKIGELAESYNNRIELFLNYSIPGIIEINIYRHDTITLFSKISFTGRQITVFSDRDFNSSMESLYNELFAGFLNHIKNQSQGTLSLIKSDSDNPRMESSLCSYSLYGFSITDELILKDFLADPANVNTDITDIKTGDDAVARSIYSAFYYFTETSFDKRILARSVKDKNFYRGFFKAISAMTGLSLQELNLSFSRFLEERYKKNVVSVPENYFLDQQTAERFTVDFSIRPGTDKTAVLKKSGKSYLVECGKSEAHTYIYLPEGPDYNSVKYLDNQTVAVTGNTKESSIILLYDAESMSLKKTVKLPSIFINRIEKFSKTDHIILNSQYGTQTGLLIIETDSGSFKKIKSQHLMKSSDLIFINDAIYYTAKTDSYELRMLNTKSGEDKVLIKLKDEISSLSISGSHLILTSNSTAGGAVFQYDIDNENLKQLYTTDYTIYKTVSANERIYILMLYKGNRRIISPETPI